jgi:hypothetical protein
VRPAAWSGALVWQLYGLRRVRQELTETLKQFFSVLFEKLDAVDCNREYCRLVFDGAWQTLRIRPPVFEMFNLP